MDLRSVWDQHRAASWPKFSSPDEGELMTLDTVISGCATYYFEEQNLDAPRLVMLGDCLGDLDALLPGLPDEAGEYFARLRSLAGLLLDTAHSGE